MTSDSKCNAGQNTDAMRPMHGLLLTRLRCSCTGVAVELVCHAACCASETLTVTQQRSETNCEVFLCMQSAPARTLARICDKLNRDNVENVTRPAALAIATGVGTASKHPLLSAESCCLSSRLSHRQRRHLVLKSRRAVQPMSSPGLLLLNCKSLWLATAFHLYLGLAETHHTARACDAEEVAHPSEAATSSIEELGSDTVLHAEPDSSVEADVGQLLCCAMFDICCHRWIVTCSWNAGRTRSKCVAVRPKLSPWRISGTHH